MRRVLFCVLVVLLLGNVVGSVGAQQATPIVPTETPAPIVTLRLEVNGQTVGPQRPLGVNGPDSRQYFVLNYTAINDPQREVMAAVHIGNGCTGEILRLLDPLPSPQSTMTVYREDFENPSEVYGIQAFDPSFPNLLSNCIIIDWTGVSATPPTSPDASVTVTPEPTGTVTAPELPIATGTTVPRNGAAVTSLPVTGYGSGQTLPVASLLIGASLMFSSMLAMLALKVFRRQT